MHRASPFKARRCGTSNKPGATILAPQHGPGSGEGRLMCRPAEANPKEAKS
jgi:hypothetical protein